MCWRGRGTIGMLGSSGRCCSSTFQAERPDRRRGTTRHPASLPRSP
jgi:hypothetical protein